MTLLDDVKHAFGIESGAATDLDARSFDKRRAALAAAKAAADAEVAQIEREAAERTRAARQKRDELHRAAVERVDARRVALAAEISGSWFGTVGDLLAAWEERDRPVSVAVQIAASWRALVERVAHELGTEPHHSAITIAIIDRRLERFPALVGVDVFDCSNDSHVAPWAQRATRSVDVPLEFTRNLRALEEAVERRALDGAASADDARRYRAAHDTVVESDRRRCVAIVDREIERERAARVAAERREHDRAYPFGSRIRDNREHAVDVDGRVADQPGPLR